MNILRRESNPGIRPSVEKTEKEKGSTEREKEREKEKGRDSHRDTHRDSHRDQRIGRQSSLSSLMGKVIEKDRGGEKEKEKTKKVVVADSTVDAAARKRQRDALLKEEEERKILYENDRIARENQMRKDLADFRLVLEKDLMGESHPISSSDFADMVTDRLIVTEEDWVVHRPVDPVMKRNDPIFDFDISYTHICDVSGPEVDNSVKSADNNGKERRGGEEGEEGGEEEEEGESENSNSNCPSETTRSLHTLPDLTFVHPFENEETVVIHFGAWSIHAGRNTNTLPSFSNLNWMGVTMENPIDFDDTLNYYRTQHPFKSGEAWRAFRRRNCAIEVDVITNWDQFESAIDCVTKSVPSVEDGHVVFTHSLFESDASRRRISEIFFEKHQIRSYFSLPAPAAAYFSTKHLHRSGLLIDCGTFETRIVPFYFGFPLLGYTRRLSGLGGIGIREYFHSLVTPSSESFLPFSRLDRMFRDKCYVSEGMWGRRSEEKEEILMISLDRFFH